MSGEAVRPRICFVATGLARGGAEAQLFRAAAGLRARGYDTHVVCMLSSGYFGARLQDANVPVTYLHASRTSNPIFILMQFMRCLRELQPAALAGFDYPGSMLARIGGTLGRVPVVISSIRSENLGSSLRRLAMSMTDSLASITTTNSQFVAHKLVGSGAASDRRVRVIPNGIDLTAVGPHLRRGRRALRRDLGVAADEFLWLAAGSLGPPKDYPNLLAAMAQLRSMDRPMKLLIAGNGPLLNALREQVTALGLDGTVSFLGLRDDLPACMAAADATVLASAWEGSPNVVIESLAVGTPVVCTDVGGVREIIQHGETGYLVPPRDPTALAASMWALMVCSTKRLRMMGTAGRRHVECHFGLDQMVSRWSGLFDELLETAA